MWIYKAIIITISDETDYFCTAFIEIHNNNDLCELALLCLWYMKYKITGSYGLSGNAYVLIYNLFYRMFCHFLMDAYWIKFLYSVWCQMWKQFLSF